MSNKRSRSRLEALTSVTGAVGMGVVIAGLLTTLVLVFINKNGQDEKVVTVSTPVSTTSVIAPTPPNAVRRHRHRFFG